MGENARKIGEKLEGFGTMLFSGFGWNEITRDREITCRRKGAHGKQTHGIDIMMNYANPYQNAKQGIIVECKNRQMKSITQAEMDKWVAELIGTIECAQGSSDLADLALDGTNIFTGLLLIHADDEYKAHLFNKYRSNLKVPSKRNPINIFVAGNEDIDRWNALLDFVEREYNDKFSFVYQSIEGSNMVQGRYLTINALYSKYVFAQQITYSEQMKDNMPYSLPMMKKILFVFDEISTETFQYLWSLFKYYQSQNAEIFEFVFYPRKTGDVEFVKANFVNTLYQISQPIDKDIEKKISLKFLDNRSLSPVDSGRR